MTDETPKCVCGQVASWVVTRDTTQTLLCQACNDLEIAAGDDNTERHGVWEENQPEGTEEIHPTVYTGREITEADFTNWVTVKGASTGLGEHMLYNVACVSINRYLEAIDREIRLENMEPGLLAPIWLTETQARRLKAALKGPQNASIRLVRKQLDTLHE